MKPASVLIAALLLPLVLAGAAGASLIGDEVTVQYIENGIIRDQATFLVTEENDDIRLGLDTLDLLTVDIQAETVEVDFLFNNRYVQGNTNFFGIKILDLDWNDPENPDWVLLGADVTRNTMTSSSLWYAEEDQRLLIDPATGEVGFDWNQMAYQRGQNFTAMFEFGPNPIPIPATMALFVTGLIGFILVRRKKKQ